jgi:YceI-like domain
MKHIFGFLAVLSFWLFCSSLIPPDHIYVTRTGMVVFRSEAISEIIKASSNALKGRLNVENKTFAFSINTKTFVGFNSPLQQEHYTENYLESNRFPESSFSGKIIEDIDFGKDGKYTIRAKGMLNIHGVSKERIIKCEIIVKNNSISVSSTFSIFLIDHDIPVPKVVHDKLSTEIKVDVKTDLFLP